MVFDSAEHASIIIDMIRDIPCDIGAVDLWQATKDLFVAAARQIRPLLRAAHSSPSQVRFFAAASYLRTGEFVLPGTFVVPVATSVSDTSHWQRGKLL